MKNYNPQNIKKITVRVALFVLLFVSYNASYGQSGVGIGTSSPNPNAILDIVSSDNDKGILIPRLTTAQRTAMNASLTSNENGLMVFDSDLDGFYFWNETNWQPITVVQDLQLDGSTLTITNNSSATNIDLAPFSGSNTDNQTLSFNGSTNALSITGGNTIDVSSLQDGVDDADNDPTNEIELPAIALTSQVLKWNGSGWVAGADQTVDGDASSSNELITGVSLVGTTTLRITEAGVNTDVNLASLQDGTGTDNQTLSFNGGTNALSISGGNSVTLPLLPAQNAFKASLGNSRLVPAGTTTGVNFDNVLYDLGGSYDGAGRYKPLVDGIYAFNGVFDVEMASDGTNFTIFITVNDVPRYSIKARTLSLGGDFIGFGFSTELELTVGDSVQFVLFSLKDQLLNGGEEYYSYIAGRLVVAY